MKKRLLIVFAILIIESIGCYNYNDGYWDTIFFDDFNRVDHDLGSNWDCYEPANATIEISNNQLLYTSDSEEDNDVYCGYMKYINNRKFKLSLKVMTGLNFEKIETVGFLFNGYPSNNKSYSVTFCKSFFAIGSTDDNTSVTSWLKSINVSLSDNTTYYLEMEIDGPEFTGYIKDANHSILYEISTSEKEFSIWSVNLMFMSNSSDIVALNVDDFKIISYIEN